jgi:hypothetical protein
MSPSFFWLRLGPDLDAALVGGEDFFSSHGGGAKMSRVIPGSRSVSAENYTVRPSSILWAKQG